MFLSFASIQHRLFILHLNNKSITCIQCHYYNKQQQQLLLLLLLLVQQQQLLLLLPLLLLLLLLESVILPSKCRLST